MQKTSTMRMEELRTEAVQYAVQACERRMPEMFARFGARGREYCVEDVHFHLDFLSSALETEEPRLFFDYLVWLTQVLESRRVAADSVSVSLDALLEFFRERLGASGTEIVTLLADARSRLVSGNIDPPAWDRSCPTPFAEVESFVEAGLAGDRRVAMRIFLSVLERTESLPETTVHLLQPALYEIGRRWQRNQVSVAQEHLVSALIQNLMSAGYATYEPKINTKLKALFACVAGNSHVLGLQMTADAFEMAGWDVHFLGADVPVREVVSHARLMRPDLIGLSAALPFHLRALRETAAAIREAFGDDTPRLVAGGVVINQFPALAAHCGAEMLGTDALAAIQAVS